MHKAVHCEKCSMPPCHPFSRPVRHLHGYCLIRLTCGFESAFLTAQDKELRIYTSSSVCLFGAEIESHSHLAYILAFSDSTRSCPFFVGSLSTVTINSSKILLPYAKELLLLDL